jgi:hypothetical protein
MNVVRAFTAVLAAGALLPSIAGAQAGQSAIGNALPPSTQWQLMTWENADAQFSAGTGGGTVFVCTPAAVPDTQIRAGLALAADQYYHLHLNLAAPARTTVDVSVGEQGATPASP